MEGESSKLSGEDEEAEHILLDLDDVAGHIDIPPNAPYILSGLDTLNPVLTIDGKIKLIGEYLETIGTCLAFSEKEGQTGGSKKEVEPVAKLNKILKFRLSFDEGNGDDHREGNTS